MDKDQLKQMAQEKFKKGVVFNNSNLIERDLGNLTSSGKGIRISGFDIVVEHLQGGSYTVYRAGQWANIIGDNNDTDLEKVINNLEEKIGQMELRLNNINHG